MLGKAPGQPPACSPLASHVCQATESWIRRGLGAGEQGSLAARWGLRRGSCFWKAVMYHAEPSHGTGMRRFLFYLLSPRENVSVVESRPPCRRLKTWPAPDIPTTRVEWAGPGSKSQMPTASEVTNWPPSRGSHYRLLPAEACGWRVTCPWDSGLSPPSFFSPPLSGAASLPGQRTHRGEGRGYEAEVRVTRLPFSPDTGVPCTAQLKTPSSSFLRDLGRRNSLSFHPLDGPRTQL